MYNIFEEAVLPTHTTAPRLLEQMRRSGATAAMMSGSGPSVFGVFPKGDGAAQSAAERAREALEALGIPAWVCEPVRE